MKEMYTANENRYDNGMKYERCGFLAQLWKR